MLRIALYWMGSINNLSLCPLLQAELSIHLINSKSEKNLVNAENQTRGSWMRSADTTPVLPAASYQLDSFSIALAFELQTWQRVYCK